MIGSQIGPGKEPHEVQGQPAEGEQRSDEVAPGIEEAPRAERTGYW